MKIKLKPFLTPNFVIPELPARPRQEGVNFESASFPLMDVDADELSEMCDAYRAEIFKKAMKPDPRLVAAPNGGKA